MTTRVSRPRLTCESAGLAAILAVAAWLRLRHLGIAMFYNEAGSFVRADRSLFPALGWIGGR